MRYERYIITNKTRDQFLVQHQSKYGTSLNMNSDEYSAKQYMSIDDARKDLVNYLFNKKTINAKMLQIVKVEYIQNDLEVIDALPKELELSLTSYGIDVYTVSKVTKEWLINKLQNAYLVKPTNLTYVIKYDAQRLYSYDEDSTEIYITPVACIINITWEE